MSCPGPHFLTLSSVVAIYVGSVEVGTCYTSIRLIQLGQCCSTHIRDVPNFPSLQLSVGRGSPVSAVSWRTTEDNNIIRSWFGPLKRPITIVSTLPKLQPGGPPFVGCLRLIIQYVRSYRHFLEAIPPSATWGLSCCDDRNPLIRNQHIALY
jgi:hypothetical protein